MSEKQNQYQQSSGQPVYNNGTPLNYVGQPQTQVGQPPVYVAQNEQPIYAQPQPYAQQPQVTYAQQPQGTYAQQPQVTYAQQPQSTYAQQPQSTYAQQPQGTYAQQPQGTYAQQPQSYAQQPQSYAVPGATQIGQNENGGIVKQGTDLNHDWYDVCGDPYVCCCATFCSCFLYAQLAERFKVCGGYTATLLFLLVCYIIDSIINYATPNSETQSNMFFGLGCFIIGFQLRSKVKEYYGTAKNCCCDCLLSFFCCCCNVIQLYRTSWKTGDGAAGKMDLCSKQPSYQKFEPSTSQPV